MAGRIVAGVILVVLGIGFLGDQMNYWDFGELLGTYWPLLLIGGGLVALAAHIRRPFGAIVLILIGVILQLERLGRIPDNWGAYAWPLVLVVLGLALLFGRRRHRAAQKHPGYGAPRATTSDQLNVKALFGGTNEVVKSAAFRGGRVEATFGGARVDLREATLAPEGAHLDVDATFGGVEVFVPPTWNVQLSGRPFLGGIDNQSAASGGSGPPLRIDATAFLGGVTIRN